jgi:hypothetical protein
MVVSRNSSAAIDPVIRPLTRTAKETRVSQAAFGETREYRALVPLKSNDPTADIDEDWTIRDRRAYPSAD